MECVSTKLRKFALIAVAGVVDPGRKDWTFIGTPDSVTPQACKLILVTLPFRYFKIGLRSGSFAVLQTSSGLKGRHNLAQGRAQGQCPAAPPWVACDLVLATMLSKMTRASSVPLTDQRAGVFYQRDLLKLNMSEEAAHRQMVGTTRSMTEDAREGKGATIEGAARLVRVFGLSASILQVVSMEFRVL